MKNQDREDEKGFFKALYKYKLTCYKIVITLKSPKMKKLKVGILGATGMVGQNYIALLENHPWFDVSFVAASEKSAGKSYGQAVEGRWHMKQPLPTKVKNLRVTTVDNIVEAKKSCDVVFSALDPDSAKIYEEKYAEAGIPVVSNASANRMVNDVPLLIPEINHDHLSIIPRQQENRGWKKGFIVAKPNCSLQSYMTPLYALHQKFKIKKVMVTTMQAISGAGYPGVAALDITDNVIPYINGEEEKSENEPLKILGTVRGNEIIHASTSTIKISAQCNRVPVIDGHLACISVEFQHKPTPEQIIHTWKTFRSLPQKLKLPFAPQQPIIYRDEQDRPQTRLDRDNGHGMAVTVGRLRACTVLDYRFVGLSHNTVRGAAGGGILNAELLKAQGFLEDLS